MTKTGTEIVTDALREIQVLDPTATASGERLADGLRAAGDLLDTWRTEKLTIGTIAINRYSLAANTQDYTIGSGGAFNQEYPESIDVWSVIPDDTVSAANLLEIPMGRPVTSLVWQQLRMKGQTGPWPTTLFFDHGFTASLGTIKVHPIPTGSHVDIVLYQQVPVMTSLVAGTSYQMRPGFSNAFTLALAITLGRGRYGKGAVMSEQLKDDAKTAKALLMRSNIRPKSSPMRPEFIIGQTSGRRTFNIYTGGT